MPINPTLDLTHRRAWIPAGREAQADPGSSFPSQDSQQSHQSKLETRKAAMSSTISLLRTTATTKRVVLLRKTYSRKSLSSSIVAQADNRIQYRDVFIYDPNVPLESWLKLDKNISWKHPKSGHIIAKYSEYRYLNSQYSFNNIGEYSLIVSAAQPILPVAATAATTSTGHSVVIFPDRLILSNVQETDISKVMDVVMKDSLTDMKTWNNLIPHCIVRQMPVPTVVISSKNLLPMDFVFKTASWFKSSLEESQGVTSSRGNMSSDDPLAILISNELGGHRNASSVLILPSEDSFEVVTTRGKVDDIIAKLQEHK